tara:strand:+ start:1381 stop:1641 length:261 start_codon:yes stop_codon:yes gene_type:complete
MNGWGTPAIGIFLMTQLGTAVWWASGTDTDVKKNTTTLEQVVDNEKEIAVIQIIQQRMQDDIVEIKDDNKELKELAHKILNAMEKD